MTPAISIFWDVDRFTSGRDADMEHSLRRRRPSTAASSEEASETDNHFDRGRTPIH